MNAGDSFTAKVLVGEYGGKFAVDARVLGVNFVRQSSKNERRLLTSILASNAVSIGVITVLTFIGLLTLYSYISERQSVPPRIVTFLTSRLPIRKGESTVIQASVISADERLHYEWAAKSGMIYRSSEEAAQYFAPNDTSTDTITLTVKDNKGREDTKSLVLELAEPAPDLTPTPPPPPSNQKSRRSPPFSPNPVKPQESPPRPKP